MQTSPENKKEFKVQLLVLLLLNYFTFMLITNIIGVLLVNWQADFKLDQSIVAILGSVFFIAYGLTSLPSGILLERIGSKKMFLLAATAICIPSIVFASMPSFLTGLVALFLIGAGVTALQIVGNLLVKKVDSDPNNYSRNLTMAQVFCGVGAACGGFLNSYFVENVAGFHWTWFYYIFAVVIAGLAGLAALTPIPEEQKPPTQNTTSEDGIERYAALLTNPAMLMFALGIFAYVGIEVGIANWIKAFMNEAHAWSFTQADKIFSLYWAFQAIGRFTGGIVLNYLNTAKALVLYACGAIISLAIAIFYPVATIAGIAFVAVGFFTSIMFPSIFSLAVNRFDSQKDTVAGILCTAIIGGAVTQLAIGFLAEVEGINLGWSMMIFGALSYLYIAMLGLNQLNVSESNATEQTTLQEA